MASLASRYKKQAQLEAALKYSPQKGALQQALMDVIAQRDSAVSAARAGGSALRASIDQSVPQVQASYDTSQNRLQGAFGNYRDSLGALRSGGPVGPPTKVADLLAGLGPAAQSIVAATLSGQQVAQTNLQDARQAAVSDLQRQRTSSVAGENQSVRQAGVDYQAGAGKILQQLLDVNGQQGAAAASDLADLVDKARGRAVTKRGQTLASQDRQAQLGETQRHNQVSESVSQQNADTARQNAQNGGKKPRLTLQQNGKIKDGITTAQGFVKQMRAGGMSDADIRTALLTGQTVYDSNEKPFAKPPKTASESIDAAFDLARSGKVSPKTAALLRKRGFQIPGQWIAKRPAANQRQGHNSTGSGLIP